MSIEREPRSPLSVWELDTEWKIWNSNVDSGTKFVSSTKRPDELRGPPSSVYSLNLFFLSGRGAKLTTYRQLVLR